MNVSPRIRTAALALGVVLLSACSSDEASSPTAPPTTPVPPATAVNVSLTASTTTLDAGASSSSIITVRATRSDNGQPVPNLTQASFTTTLGSFGSVGGPNTLTAELINGEATVAFFGGTTIGTATIRAQVQNGVGLLSINVREPNTATFFVSSVTPNTGSPQGGETVTVNGGGFSDPIRVTFDGTPATIQNASASQIRVTTPPLLTGLPPGSTQAVAVAVTINRNEADEATDTIPNGFIYANGGGNPVLQPTIFSITPASGPNEGGTQVTINGDGFEAPVQVKFGTGTSDANFNGAEAQIISVSRTRIVVIAPPTSCASPCAPPNPNQLVNILVKNQATSRFTVATSAFRYGSQIVITAIAPGEGPTAGGTQVTIFGQGFDEPVAVTMGTRAQQVISTSGSEIVVRTVAVTPTSCADISGATIVTNIETGQSATGPVFVYRVPRPIITGVAPTSGGQAGGTGVTISGIGFEAPMTVTFGTFAGSVSLITPTSVSTTTPAFPDSLFAGGSPCNDDADATTGFRFSPVSVDVTLRNPVTTCTTTLAGAFRVNPTDTSCQND